MMLSSILISGDLTRIYKTRFNLNTVRVIHSCQSPCVLLPELLPGATSLLRRTAVKPRTRLGRRPLTADEMVRTSVASPGTSQGLRRFDHVCTSV